MVRNIRECCNDVPAEQDLKGRGGGVESRVMSVECKSEVVVEEPIAMVRFCEWDLHGEVSAQLTPQINYKAWQGQYIYNVAGTSDPRYQLSSWRFLEGRCEPRSTSNTTCKTANGVMP